MPNTLYGYVICFVHKSLKSPKPIIFTSVQAFLIQNIWYGKWSDKSVTPNIPLYITQTLFEHFIHMVYSQPHSHLIMPNNEHCLCLIYPAT